jgi:hypothetical protein
MEQTKQEKFDEMRNRIIGILKNLKLENDPHFIFISQDIGHKSEIRMITKSCPSFMFDQSVNLAQTAGEEQDKDDLLDIDDRQN